MIITVEFENKGQDFLEWDIDFGTYGDYVLGKVVDVRPEFQKHIWTKYSILSGEPMEGKLLQISVSPEDPVEMLKYKIVKVSEK